MSSDTKPTTRKQKLLITLIIITVGLLFISLLMNGSAPTTSENSIDRETCLQQGNVWDKSSQQCYGNAAVLTSTQQQENAVLS